MFSSIDGKKAKRVAVLLVILAACWIGARADAAAITWVGNGTTNPWDKTSLLWDSNGDGIADTVYADTDTVTFSDSGSATPWIRLKGLMSPGSVTFNVASAEYVVTGADNYTNYFLGGSTGIDKYGLGKVIVDFGAGSSTSAFTGAVNVHEGTLAAIRSGSVGNSTGITRVHDGATLDIMGGTLKYEDVYVQGSGVGGLGALYNGFKTTVDPATRLDQPDAFSDVTLEGDTTVGGVGRIDIKRLATYGGTLVASDGAGGGYDLTVKMTGKDVAPTDPDCDYFVLAGLNVIDLGNVYVDQGVFGLSSSGAGLATDAIVLGDGTVNPATRLRLLGLNSTGTLAGSTPVGSVSKEIVANGGGIFVDPATGYGNDNHWHGSVTLNFDLPVAVAAGRSLTFYNNAAGQGVVGDGGITLFGGGTLTLEGTNTYAGVTTVEAGTLALGASATLSGTTTIETQVGSFFNVSLISGGFTLGGSQTLMGGGTVLGDVVAEGTVEAGSSVGKLTFQDDLDLSAGGMTWELGALVDDADGIAGTDFDQTVVGGDLALGGTSKLTLDLSAVGVPSLSVPFWTAEHTWTVIDGTSNAGGEAFADILGGTYAAGSFETLVGSGDKAGDVLLKYTPVPEPSVLLVLVMGLGMLTLRRR